jgi:hypothetical protein
MLKRGLSAATTSCSWQQQKEDKEEDEGGSISRSSRGRTKRKHGSNCMPLWFTMMDKRIEEHGTHVITYTFLRKHHARSAHSSNAMPARRCDDGHTTWTWNGATGRAFLLLPGASALTCTEWKLRPGCTLNMAMLFQSGRWEMEGVVSGVCATPEKGGKGGRDSQGREGNKEGRGNLVMQRPCKRMECCAVLERWQWDEQRGLWRPLMDMLHC